MVAVRCFHETPIVFSHKRCYKTPITDKIGHTLMIKNTLIRTSLALIICLITFTGAPCASEVPASTQTYYQQLSPLKEQIKTEKEIFKHLRRDHYRKIEIDDKLSSIILDKYLSDLDPFRNFFLASDIMEFETYRFGLDDALKKGELAPAFKIYNRYQLRLIERLVYLTNRLSLDIKNINFDLDDSFETDRDNSPWPGSRRELENLWEKGLKNDILNLILDEKPIDEVKELLLKRYRNQLSRVGQTKSEDVFQQYMNSFAKTFDPHTQYFSPRTSENFNINMSLSLEGIGAMLTTENEFTKIVRLIPAGPADKAGELKPDDRIIGVGQGADEEIVDVVGWRLDDVVALIRGPKESNVRLKIIPADAVDDHQTKVIQITRNTVRLEEQAAKSELIELKKDDAIYRLGVITIPTFYLDIQALRKGKPDFKSTTRDVMRLLAELNKERVDGIIIDIRDNGGGSLQEADTLTGLFIKHGPVVQIKYANQKVDRLYDRDPRIFYSGPLAVVVNRLSASASEIFAGAIQDYGRGIIIGEDTFGKGTVQTLVGLDRGQLKMTSAKFYRISGASTQHKGITPDILYPSLYDKEKIGESSLEEALAWDTIYEVPHQTYPELSQLIPKLNERHIDRIKDDADYAYLQAMIEYLDTLRDKTQISLNKHKREEEHKQAQKTRLDLENKRRKARDLPPLKDLDEMEKDKDKEEDKKAQDDPVIIESGNILVDLMTISNMSGNKNEMVRSH